MTDSRHTLLLRLAGPMQSWGVRSRFTVRDTAMEPTKSGVIGLLCAALGRPRHVPIDDLARLRMCVRVDRQGTKKRDYQTSGQSGYLRARGKVEKKDVIPTERYYLSGAHFTVALEGGDEDLGVLQSAHKALESPCWPVSLGRKAFPPGLPVFIKDGLREDTGLLAALEQYRDPWLSSQATRPPSDVTSRRFSVELIEGDDAVEDEISISVVRTQPDQPVSFQPRKFAPRRIGIFHRSTLPIESQ